jgi:FkbM family methyltransferase
VSKLSRRWRRLRQAVQEWAGATYELDGVRFTLPSWADDVKRNILKGRYEEPERRLVAKWLDPACPVVELGGAFGIVSGVVGAQLAAGTPHVVVEANPALVEFCRSNAAAARPAGAPVTVIGAAIAYGGNGYAEFWPSDAFLGSRLARRGEAGTIRVPATSLGSVLASTGLGEYTLVCDIEGAELDLVGNEANLLARCRLAIFELHPDAFADKGSSEDEFIGLLAGAGLDVVDRDGNVIVAQNRALAEHLQGQET